MPLEIKATNAKSIDIEIGDSNDTFKLVLTDDTNVEILTIDLVNTEVIRFTSLGGPFPAKSCFELKPA